MPTKYEAADPYFTSEGFVNCCSLCTEFTFKGQSQRRKYEHLLGIGTTVRSCKARKELPDDVVEQLQKDYDSMVEKSVGVKKRKLKQVVEIDKLVTPKKQQKKLGFKSSKKDDIDMEYARMICMTSSKTTFMESKWTQNFFEKNFNYSPPSRSTVIRNLIPQLYKDTKEKVTQLCNFSDPDSLCTLSTDGWQAPDGTHI